MDSSQRPDQGRPIEPVDNTSPDVPLGAGLDLADPNSPLAPLYLRLGHVIAVGLVLLFVFYVRLLPTASAGGLWAQLALGRWAVENGRVPVHEPISSASDPDSPLPSAGWLGEVLLFLAYRTGANLAGGGDLSRLAGGVEMLRTVHLVLTVGFCFLAVFAYSRRSGSLALGGLGLMLLVPAVPVLLNALCTGLLGYLCFLALLGLVGREQPSWLGAALSALLMALWANLDASFAIGLCLLAMLVLGQLVTSIRDVRMLRLVAALGGSALLAGLLNPSGFSLYSHLVAWSSRPAIGELGFWQPLNFSEWRAVHVVFLISLVGLALAAAASRRAYSQTEMAVLLGMGLLALWKQGAVGWWFLVVPWLLQTQFVALGERPGGGASSPAGNADLRKTFVGAVLGLAILLMVLPVHWIRLRRPQSPAATLAPDIPWPLVPHLTGGGAGEFLPEVTGKLQVGYPDGKFSGLILADINASDFFLFTVPSGPPVYLYSQVGLFPRERWQDYLAVRDARADWWEILDRDGVNLIVINPGQAPKLAEALEEDPAWLLVQGKGAHRAPWLIALRKTPLPGSLD